MTVQDQIENLTCNALEGGSNYWYMIEDHNMKDTVAQFLSEVPTTDNGYLMMTDDCEQLKEPFRLDRKALVNGLKVMKQKYDWHYKDVVNENDDAITADVFLQCAIFGEIVYG